MPRPATSSSSDSSDSASQSTAQEAVPVYADVLVPRHLNRSFTYRIPPPLRSRLTIGSLVTVPFGHSTVQGLVVDMWGARQKPASGALPLPLSRLKDILAVPDDDKDGVMSAELLELTRFVADRYLAPWGQCIRLAVPPSGAGSTAKPRSKRGPKTPPPGQEAPAPLSLPPLPAAWQTRLSSVLNGAAQAPLLLRAPLAHRIAGYMEACRLTLAGRRTVLIVSPDIARASLIAGAAAAQWGKQVELLHSGLPPAARAEAWHRIRTGTVQVVVGTRSAVFAPLASLGCICVDQEDDASLKEEQEPRYHAREVARMRARQHQAVLLLGSSHPSLESWQELNGAGLAGDGSARAPSRLTIAEGDGLTPPEMQLVDLRRQPYGTLLSQLMIDGIQAAVAQGDRAVLFLNRKGFAPALLCRDCGNSSQCPQCTVTLTYYRKAGQLGCRYCGLSLPLPETCPTCHAARLEPVGSGTERLEEVLKRRFAQARIIRLDRERARTPDKAEQLRRQAATGEWDILIGTQMLFQGTPLPPVGFVGIPQADEGLHAPDFRAAERTYHALMDAVELARPGHTGGRVLLQTYLPAHHTVASVIAHNPELFYEEEMNQRRALGYPPAACLISLRVSGKEAAQVQQAARRWAKLIGSAQPASAGQAQVTVMGPIPATIAQLRGRHRWQLLVKSADGEDGRLAVKSTLDKMEQTYRKDGFKFEVDVDPMEMA